MSVYYAEEGFQPTKLDMALVGRADYWEDIATQAISFFNEKEWFMNWVTSHYFDDEHRFAASVCWDLVQLKLMDGGEDG